MESEPKRVRIHRVTWLNLHKPPYNLHKDIRQCVYQYLTLYDQLLIKRAHGIKVRFNYDFIHYCAENGYLQLLKWVRKRISSWYWNIIYIGNVAAKNGHLHILRWIHKNGHSFDNTDAFANAAGNAHLHILKWLRKRGYIWDTWTCTCAAEGGHLDILKWARENGCPWNEEACNAATGNGHRHVVEWIHANNPPCQCIQ